MADKRKHRQMTSADQARYSESLYGRGAVEARPVVEPRTSSRRSSTARPSSAHMAPSRAEGVDAYRQRRRKKGAGRVLRVLLVTVLVVLAGAGTAVGLWLADLNNRLADKNVVSDDLRQQLVAVEPQEPFYMLLLGVDKSEGRSEEWGADLGVDFLACGIGNIHGIYPENWAGLSFERLGEIKALTGDLPLVLHGGTGIPVEQIQKAISLGISKINVNTDLQVVFAEATRKYIEAGKDQQGKGYDPRKLLKPGRDAIVERTKELIEEFGSTGKSWA